MGASRRRDCRSSPEQHPVMSPMRPVRHIAVNAILAPWLGGTLLAFCSYANREATTLPHVVEWAFQAMFAALVGMVVTSPVNALCTAVSLLTFLLISAASISSGSKATSIFGVTVLCSLAYGLFVQPIAADIGVSRWQLVTACAVAGIFASLLNCRNWLRLPRQMNQPSSMESPQCGS